MQREPSFKTLRSLFCRFFRSIRFYLYFWYHSQAMKILINNNSFPLIGIKLATVALQSHAIRFVLLIYYLWYPQCLSKFSYIYLNKSVRLTIILTIFHLTVFNKTLISICCLFDLCKQYF